MTRRVHSYVVQGDEGGALLLCEGDGYPRGGVLLVEGRRATVFPSRRSANRAIACTREYAKERGYAWGVWHYSVVRLEGV